MLLHHYQTICLLHILLCLFQVMNLVWEGFRREKTGFEIYQYGVYFHHDRTPTFDIIKNNEHSIMKNNVSIVVKKSSHQYMSRPFGNCSDYRIPDKTLYNSMSYIECYRKCLTHQYIKKWECVPYLMQNFITEYDLTNDETRCSTNRDDIINRRRDQRYIVEKCLRICPKECFQVEYSSKAKERETYFDNQFWSKYFKTFYRPQERVIVWDSNQPMIAYIDEPVMTFTQYLVNCGGLMGLWFGQSLKDMFSLLIDKTFWRSVYHKIQLIYVLTAECISVIIIKIISNSLLSLINWIILIRNTITSKISQF